MPQLIEFHFESIFRNGYIVKDAPDRALAVSNRSGRDSIELFPEELAQPSIEQSRFRRQSQSSNVGAALAPRLWFVPKPFVGSTESRPTGIGPLGHKHDLLSICFISVIRQGRPVSVFLMLRAGFHPKRDNRLPDMMPNQDWPRIAVVGAGAVGGYFGGVLARAGAPVIFIGRKPFVDIVNSGGLLLDKAGGTERVSAQATTDISAVSGADLVLFCVKSNDTIATARQMKPFLAPGSLVVCLQNGVDNAERVQHVTGLATLTAAVYIGVSMPEPGHIKHVARGDIVLGPENDQSIRAETIFRTGGIPCRISDNIDGEMWAKLLVNCALNAISAIGNSRYGEIAASKDACQVMRRVVDEVLAVAQAAGINLPDIPGTEGGMTATMAIATQMSAAFSSTAQDIRRGKRTEIDSLNGFIAMKGAELGVNVPVNHALFTLVRLLEQSRAQLS
jgi:2-dehydropantoate 2-reductase